MVPKKPGEVSAFKAAKILSVDPRTTTRWCKTQRFATARQDHVVNRYYVSRAEVMRIKDHGWPQDSDIDT